MIITTTTTTTTITTATTTSTTVVDCRGSLSSEAADAECWLPLATIARIRRTFSASDSDDLPEAPDELIRLFLRWCGVSRLCSRRGPSSFSVKSSDSEKPTLRVLPAPSSASSYDRPPRNYYYTVSQKQYPQHF